MLKGSVYYEPKNKDYIDIIVSRTKLDPERTIKSLNDKEFDSFWRAIEFVEDWIEGEEDFIPRGIIFVFAHLPHGWGCVA